MTTSATEATQKLCSIKPYEYLTCNADGARLILENGQERLYAKAWLPTLTKPLVSIAPAVFSPSSSKYERQKIKEVMKGFLQENINSLHGSELGQLWKFTAGRLHAMGVDGGKDLRRLIASHLVAKFFAPCEKSSTPPCQEQATESESPEQGVGARWLASAKKPPAMPPPEEPRAQTATSCIAKKSINNPYYPKEITTPVRLKAQRAVIVSPKQRRSPLEKKDLQAGIRAANDAWFFGGQPSLDELTTLANTLYELAMSGYALSAEEWTMAARAFLPIVEKNDEKELLEKAQKLFLQRYITHERNQRLPEEFFQLIYKLSQKTSVGELVTFIKASRSPALSLEPTDPNAARALRALEEEFVNSNWQAHPIVLESFSALTDKPWRTESDKKTDRQLLTEMCSRLRKVPKGIENLLEGKTLDSINLVLLFALTSHTFKEGQTTLKRDFLALENRLGKLYQAVSTRVPMNQAEQIKGKDFCKLYQLCQGSAFRQRVEAESTTSKGRISLWGPQVDSPLKLAGITTTDFSLPELTAALEEVRKVAARDLARSRGRRTKKAPMGDGFRSEPTAKYAPPGAVPMGSWQAIFSDSGLSHWAEGQALAFFYAEAIKEKFAAIEPTVNLTSLVSALEANSTAGNHFLQRFEDHGLAILKEYIYPYVVLTKRAQAAEENVSAKFIAGAASPEEVLSLGASSPEGQAEVLKNVVRLMGPAEELNDSVIHSSQIKMLATMIGSIRKRKPVFIGNDTGAGKTTMSKLAALIVSLPVPAVIHVAPFPQQEKGWASLTSWKGLQQPSHGKEPRHFWITAHELAKLMAAGIPAKIAKTLQQSFWVMDEYDSSEYQTLATDSARQEVYSSIQDDLLLSHGCQRIANMSATPNLKTLDHKISLYEKKIAQLGPYAAKEPFAGSVALFFEKLEQARQQREQLISSIAREWSRHITIRPLPDQEELAAWVETVFEDVKALPFSKNGDQSFLLEMPGSVLTPSVIERIQAKMASVFLDQPLAMLFRDNQGRLLARTTTDGAAWKTVPMEAFHEGYAKDEVKPIVLCLYAQDSVGGDFGIFSNERAVRGQFILYPKSVAPSYAIFQNMRRQRTAASTTPSATPVFLYVGKEAMESISPESATGYNDAELNIFRKKRLLEKATAVAKTLSHARELSRLRAKAVRKKQALLNAVAQLDVQKLRDSIATEQESSGQGNTALSHAEANKSLQETASQKLESTIVDFDEPIETLRIRTLKGIVHDCQVPVTDIGYQAEAVVRNETFLGFGECLGREDNLNLLIEHSSPYEGLQKLIAHWFKAETTAVDVWERELQRRSRLKGNVTLHPVPTRQAIAEALRALRGGAAADGSKGVPDIFKEIEARAGLSAPSDQMMKAIIGTPIKDQEKAANFFKNVKQHFLAAQAYQERHRAYLERHSQELVALKKQLNRSIDSLATQEPGSFLKPINVLSEELPEIAKEAAALEQCQRQYEQFAAR